MSGYNSFDAAALNTVDPNPTVYGYGDTSTTDQITQIGNVAGQWGTAIASIVTGHPVASVAGPNGVQTIGAAGSTFQTTQFSSSSGILLLLGGAVILFLLLRSK